jgi:hypothetical protein
MTLEEAIVIVNLRPRNVNLQWIVYKFNDGYAIGSSSYYKRHPDIEYEYATGDLNRIWKRQEIDGKLIHVVINTKT